MREHRYSILIFSIASLLLSSCANFSYPRDPKETLQPDRDLASHTQSTRLEITQTTDDLLRIDIINSEELEDDEVYVLESSQDLLNWEPYKIYVNSVSLLVPKRYDAEFFRLVLRALPEVRASGSLQVINYQPEMIIDRGPDEEPLIIPEQGTFFIIGSVSIKDPTELNQFPNIRSHFPIEPNSSLAPFEIGVSGLSAGHRVYDFQTSFGWRSPDFNNRSDALNFLDSLEERAFIVPRFVD